MKIEFVDLKAQYHSIQAEIDQAFKRVMEDSAFIKGKYLEEFEKAYAQFSCMPFCVGCANGTDSLEIALRALGIGAGDEVIVPAHTWISTAEAVTAVGARVVFVDVHPRHYTMSLVEVQKKITKKTKALIPVHLYGLPAEMNELVSLAREHSLKIIEDCAQAHGATYRGALIGTFGDIASYSFFPSKNLGAYGDAGALVMRDSKLAEVCRMIGDHGRLGKHDHGLEGRNSRLDGLQASILLAKLPHLQRWISARQQNARLYGKYLEGLPIQLPEVPEYSTHAYHLYVIQVSQRDAVQRYLSDLGIQTGVHYPTALPYLSAYQYLGHTAEDFPVAHASMNRILSLPLYPELTEEQIQYVACHVRIALERYL